MTFGDQAWVIPLGSWRLFCLRQDRMPPHPVPSVRR